MTIHATQFVRRMRGGAQSSLLLCNDGYAYVVKFQNNPQHVRVLANEWLATKIAESIGLSVPPCEIVHVDNALIARTADLVIARGHSTEPCQAGLQFGSRLVGGLFPGQTVDYLPEKLLTTLDNLHELGGFLAFDKWACNADGRQAIFYKERREKTYKAAFIDQGYCFNAESWKFTDAPLRGVYARSSVYREVTGWQSFEPWLTRLEELPIEHIWNLAKRIPQEWYDGHDRDLTMLVETLDKRRPRIRELITDFRRSTRQPFPLWREN